MNFLNSLCSVFTVQYLTVYFSSFPLALFNEHLIQPSVLTFAPCGLRGCKNGPAPFPGRMSYKATKPGLVSVLYLSMFFYCVGVY